jgi:hypothetical protein
MTIKHTLIKEARFLSNVERSDLAKLSEFANKYFAKPKANELVEAMKKSPDAAQNWLEKNY